MVRMPRLRQMTRAAVPVVCSSTRLPSSGTRRRGPAGSRCRPSGAGAAGRERSRSPLGSGIHSVWWRTRWSRRGSQGPQSAFLQRRATPSSRTTEPCGSGGQHSRVTSLVGAQRSGFAASRVARDRAIPVSRVLHSSSATMRVRSGGHRRIGRANPRRSAIELEVSADLTSSTCLGLECLGLVAKLGDGGAEFSQLLDL